MHQGDVGLLHLSLLKRAAQTGMSPIVLRYEQQTAAYTSLLTGRYPSFNISVSE